MLYVVQGNWSTVKLLSNYFQVRLHFCASHHFMEKCRIPGRKMYSLPGKKCIFLHIHASFLLGEEAPTVALLAMTLWPSKWLVRDLILEFLYHYAYSVTFQRTKSTNTCHKEKSKLIYNVHVRMYVEEDPFFPRQRIHISPRYTAPFHEIVRCTVVQSYLKVVGQEFHCGPFSLNNV